MTTGRNVLLTNPIDPAGTKILEDAGCRVVVAPDQKTETLIGLAEDADILIVRSKISEELLARAPRLKGIVRHGVGLDFIPVEAATARGIMVANAPGTNAIAVAEYVFSALHNLKRPIVQMDQRLRTDGWREARQIADTAGEIHAQTLGIVGLGNVGQVVARIGRFGYGMRVLGYQPRTDRFPAYVEAVSLGDLFARSSTVVLCCPLTPATQGLVNAELLARLHPAATLINVGRGPLVVEEALIQVLQEQKIAGAALDVFSIQPLPAAHPYFQLKNLLLTPHIAGITAESMTRMSVVSSEEVLRMLGGEKPNNFVNPESWVIAQDASRQARTWATGPL
jgi:D-3-phosphoglycerate dehydrogenase